MRLMDILRRIFGQENRPDPPRESQIQRDPDVPRARSQFEALRRRAQALGLEVDVIAGRDRERHPG